jgi:tubulin polyglutamylase TTLL5
MIYLYDDGLVRFSTEKYSEDKSKLTNNYIHLTNASVNENSSKYIKNADFDNLKESTSSLSSFKKYCNENKIDYNKIIAKIKDSVIKAILSNYDSAVRELKRYNLPSCQNLFELFGVEVILDKDYNPYIIGFNSKPGLFTNSEVGKKLYDNVMCDFLNIIGIRKYNRKSMKKNNRICTLEENLKECTKELERYKGHFELIFPLKGNIDKYSKFINNKTQLNTELWNLLNK